MTNVATFGGGCFWCLEAVFEQVDGVQSVRSGYAGGHMEHPTYRQVCSSNSGHAEVVRVEFDPDRVSYHDLLEIFFGTHDPTTLNRQGGDVGTQYRSVIFAHDDAQRAAASALIDELTETGVFGAPIVTTIEPDAPFYEAEAYHQEYYRANPAQPYCQVVIGPKVAKFRERFRDRLRR